MMHKIEQVAKEEYVEVVDIWEASVRATHRFLKEEDILYFKPLILNEYLKAVDLRSIKDRENRIVGFLGVAKQNLEMLFIHPEVFGKGLGKALLMHAIKELGVTRVDVNEDNIKALGFYQHLGFEIISRSELDSSGKPYPVLHMQLKEIE